MPDKNRRRFVITAVLIIALSALFSRLCGVFYSITATDILYAETFLPQLLEWGRDIFYAVSFGAGIASAAAAVFRMGQKIALSVFGIHAAVLFADAASALLIDALTSAVSGGTLILAILVNLCEWLFAVLLAFVGYRCAVRFSKTGKKTLSYSLVCSSLICLAGWVLLRVIDILGFLIEVEFQPYTSEIVLILGEVLQTVFLYGGVVWISAVGTEVILRKTVIDREN